MIQCDLRTYEWVGCTNCMLNYCVYLLLCTRTYSGALCRELAIMGYSVSDYGWTSLEQAEKKNSCLEHKSLEAWHWNIESQLQRKNPAQLLQFLQFSFQNHLGEEMWLVTVALKSCTYFIDVWSFQGMKNFVGGVRTCTLMISLALSYYLWLISLWQGWFCSYNNYITRTSYPTWEQKPLIWGVRIKLQPQL